MSELVSGLPVWNCANDIVLDPAEASRTQGAFIRTVKVAARDVPCSTMLELTGIIDIELQLAALAIQRVVLTPTYMVPHRWGVM